MIKLISRAFSSLKISIRWVDCSTKSVLQPVNKSKPTKIINRALSRILTIIAHHGYVHHAVHFFQLTRYFQALFVRGKFYGHLSMVIILNSGFDFIPFSMVVQYMKQLILNGRISITDDNQTRPLNSPQL